MVFRLIGLLVLMFCGVLFSLFSGISGCAGPSSSSSSSFPETCLEAKELAIDETGSTPSDGTYTLYVDGDEAQPWDAYCYNMSRSEPLEYLTVTEADNYSQIRNDSSVAETTYRRWRIDPATLEIDPLDDTFATSDFDSFTPVFPVDTMESIPGGWAEVQPVSFNAGTAAESNASLEGTAFAFSETILTNDLADFFCQVDSTTIQPDSTAGTGAEVASDLLSFHLTAVNTNSEIFMGVSTREVADCDNLGPTATDFTTAAWPLEYVGAP